MPISPTPRQPIELKFKSGSSIHVTSIYGMSALTGEAATQAVAADAHAAFFAGGATFIDLMKLDVMTPEQAGIPLSRWNSVNMTGDAAAEARLTGQLNRNGLTSQGTSTVAPNQE
jgi:hypothetical protein